MSFATGLVHAVCCPVAVTSTHIFNEQTREFEFQPGSGFKNTVLVNEINRISQDLDPARDEGPNTR